MAKLAILAVLLAVGLSYFWFVQLGDLPAPVLDENQFWGPATKKGQKEDTSIRPFKINIDDKILKDLKARLQLETSDDGNRLTPPLEGIGFQYGFNTNCLKTVAKYWLEKYDWKAREKLLNKYPSFKTTLNGIEIHFQHVKSGANNGKYKVTRPLLLLHGWPGSFIEFQKSIPLLIYPVNADVNFELIIPSLPGYGFSERSHIPGLGAAEIAVLFKKLMERLGHSKYYVQGGDWGSVIGANMATLYPKNVKGFHSNLCFPLSGKTFIKQMIAAIYPTFFMSPEEAAMSYPLGEKVFPVVLEETGYNHIQSTKPDTVGVGLSNSPIGLLAYILEKFSTWTNLEWRNKPDGGLEPYYKLDDLLDNIMVYWVTNSITSSMRLYSETLNKNQFSYNLDSVPVQVPTACLVAPKEMLGFSRWLLQDKYPNLQRHAIASKGGHFLAFEAPEVLTKDVINFFDTLEKSNVFAK